MRRNDFSGQLSLFGVMVWVAAGFFLALRIGFALHRDPTPDVFANVPLTALAAVVVVFGSAMGIVRAIRSLRRPRVDQGLVSEMLEARRRRVAELASDPQRERYAPLVERGETWSDDDIEYFEHPERTTTCVHLEPIERALRRSGIEMRRHDAISAVAHCVVDFDALKRLVPNANGIRYGEYYMGERGEYDHPVAYLICDDHRSMIHTTHPDAPEATRFPRFPTL